MTSIVAAILPLTAALSLAACWLTLAILRRIKWA